MTIAHKRILPLTTRFAPLALAAMAMAELAMTAQPPPDPFTSTYAEVCAACHGANLEGTPQGLPLAGRALVHGDSVDDIARSIAQGLPGQRMPAFSATLDPLQIRRMAIFIAEKRAELSYADFAISRPPVIPEGTVASQKHSFRIETVATGIDPLPYSLAPLPDGSLLLSEKTRGLRIVSPDGTLSPLVRGTPEVFNDGFQVPGILLVYGLGYLLDVAAASGLREERLDLPCVHRALQRLQRGRAQLEATGLDDGGGARAHPRWRVGGPAGRLEDADRELHRHAGHGRGRAPRLRRQGSRVLHHRHQGRIASSPACRISRCPTARSTA